MSLEKCVEVPQIEKSQNCADTVREKLSSLNNKDSLQNSFGRW